jgi:hypothetical protein
MLCAIQQHAKDYRLLLVGGGFDAMNSQDFQRFLLACPGCAQRNTCEVCTDQFTNFGMLQSCLPALAPPGFGNCCV